MITALAGGVGAGRMLQGLVQVVDQKEITAIVNTGDDMVYCGLYISPDLDTVTRMIAGTFNEVKGYGKANDSWTVLDTLKSLGGDTWFELGDEDLATHLFRTRHLENGESLTHVAQQLAAAAGLEVTLLAVTDDAFRTRILLTTGEEVSFQEYFAKLRHSVPVASIRFEGADVARPSPGVLEAIRDAEFIVCCPSNPVLSIEPLLAIDGIRSELEARREDVVGISPIVGGQAIKGPAARLLAELGWEPTVVGVAKYYAPWVHTLVIDEVDAHLADHG